MRNAVLAISCLLLLSGCSGSDKVVNPPPGVGVWASLESGIPLYGVWGASATNVFAVGEGGTVGRSGGPDER